MAFYKPYFNVFVLDGNIEVRNSHTNFDKPYTRNLFVLINFSITFISNG